MSAAPKRSLRELLIAKNDGEEVSEDDLRVYRREEDLIRALIAYPRVFEGSSLSAAMFQAPDYRIAYQAIERARAVHLGDAPLHPENVLAEMRRTGETRFALPAGNLWMASVRSQPSVDVVYALEVLVPEVVARHQLRIWKSRYDKLGERVASTTDLIGLHQEWITESFRVASAPDGGRLGPTLQELSWDATNRHNPNIIPTGVPEIDRAAGGGHGRGDLMVIGGGTNHGKSYFAARLLRNQARLGRACLYVSAEDPLELMQCRMYADYSDPRLRPVDIRDRSADPFIVERAIAAAAAEQRGLVHLFAARKWPIARICAVIRRHRYMAGVDLVIVDYVQAIQPNEPMHNKTQEVAFIVSELKRTANDCGIGLVLLSQYSREEYKDGQEPSLNACKYAGDIENEAEIMVLFWRDENDALHAKLPKVKWAKARDLRFIVQTDPVSGCICDWEDDFSQPVAPRQKRNASANGA